MKAKRIGLIAIIVFSAVCVLLINESLAQGEKAGIWKNCTVDRAGPGGGGLTYIALTDTASPRAFTNRVFIADGNRKKEMLAVAMTAIVNGNIVYCNISGTGAQYSTILTFQLKK